MFIDWLLLGASTALLLVGAWLAGERPGVAVPADGARSAFATKLAAALACSVVATAGYWYLLRTADAAAATMIAGTGVAAGITLLIHWVVRVGASSWYLVAALLAIVITPQLAEDWGSYWHGYMHSAIVYEIVERGVPPQNPLMAGEILRYMYGHHALIAALMTVLPISPPRAFALTDAVALVALAWLVYRLAGLIDLDRYGRILAVFIAFFGFMPFVAGPFAEQADAVLPGGFDPRFIPLSKFVGINNNQLGLVFFAMTLLGLGRIAVAKPPAWRAHALIGAGIVGSAFIYPPAWLGMVACAAVAGGSLLLATETAVRRAGIGLVAVTLVFAGVSAPAVLGVTGGKSGESAIRFLFTGDIELIEFARNVLMLGYAVAFPLLLAVVGRSAVLQRFREAPRLWTMLLLSGVVSQAMYVSMAIPGRSEYKFLGFSVLALCVPIAAILRDIALRRRALALLAVFFLALPAAYHVAETIVGMPVLDPPTTAGRMLHHRDPVENELYTWIAESTPVDALFVDDYLTVPVFGRRQLLVGTDMRRQYGAWRSEGFHDGWLIRAREFLIENTGVPSAALEQLQSLARNVLQADQATDSAAVDDLVRYANGRPLYVVARTPEQIAKLASVHGMRAMFRGRTTSVFEVATPHQ